MRRFTSVSVHTAHFGQHTEITLQDTPNREYDLSLFVENVESELQKRDNHTWVPSQRPYVSYFPNSSTHWWICVYRGVSPTSQIRAEVRMKTGHSVWAKYRDASEVIDLHELFSDYWSSDKHEFTVQSQSLSPSCTHRSDREGQRVLSLENIVSF